MITCGHCKSQHATVDAVRQCSQQPKEFAAIRTATPTVALATPAQVKYLNVLVVDRDHDYDLTVFAADELPKKEASAMIDRLLSFPRKPKTAEHPGGELKDGIYRADDGTLLRVYHTVHGANKQVASKILLSTEQLAKKDRFEYLGQAGLKGLTAAHMLPFEEGVKISATYGWCCACGTILHNDKSVELGIGPVCRGKFA